VEKSPSCDLPSVVYSLCTGLDRQLHCRETEFNFGLVSSNGDGDSTQAAVRASALGIACQYCRYMLLARLYPHFRGAGVACACMTLKRSSPALRMRFNCTQAVIKAAVVVNALCEYFR
jgi:hypothetical protein